jgi:Zn-finger nucleic acid-binding protein
MFNRKKTGEVPLDCPRCSRAMTKINKEDVIIDVCPSCKGMWLDSGEIEKLTGMTKSSQDKQKNNRNKGEKKDGKR